VSSICPTCGSPFAISPEEAKWYARVGFPLATDCFTCHQKHHLIFRNSRSLHHRVCNATGQAIISIYAPDLPYKVFRSDVWFGDTWDAVEMGRPFDFSRPFFEQFHELDLAVPRLSLNNVQGENSDYCNMTYGNRNCYLVFGGDFNEDTMYGTLCMHNRSCMDIDFTNESELCSEISNSVGCYGCHFTFDCKNCSGCSFISDCTGCRDCILCTNLTQKSHCIRNQQLTREEYERQAALLLDGTYAHERACLAEFLTLLKKRIVKYAHMIGCQNCTGDYQQHSKNCLHSFDVFASEDLCNVIFASKSKDCFRCSLLGNGAELCYDLISVMLSKECRFCCFVVDSSNIDYSLFIFNCHHLFGCAGLRRKQYCILNKQYTKEEYEKLVEKIIDHMKKTGEWGKYFPKKLSPFAYNETTAQEYFPLKKEEAIAQGFRWRDVQDEVMGSTKSIRAPELPDNITEISDDILSIAIASEKSGRPFRIQKSELEFYRKIHRPLPRLHPDERFRWRKTMRNPRHLWSRSCMKCGKGMETSYAPDRPETVYCEECYLKEVY